MIALAQSKKRLSGLAAVLPKVVAAGLTVLVGYSLAGLTWRLFLPAPETPIEVVARAPMPTTTPEQHPDYAGQIANLHLFGQAPQPQAAQVLAAPETRLKNLTLRGVYATGDKQALAIIGGGGNERFYRVGDAIAGGVTLNAVYSDRVILEHNGRMETLRLPRSKDASVLSVANSASPGASSFDLMAETYYRTTQFGGASSHLPNGQTSQVDLGELRQEILQDPGRLSDMVQATAEYENGKFKGYKLIPQGNPQLFSQLGLQEGDIVTAVNGIALDRPDKGLLALQDLVKADQVSVTLLRDGAEITVEHSLGP
jgi:general secretion pathway protein C